MDCRLPFHFPFNATAENLHSQRSLSTSSSEITLDNYHFAHLSSMTAFGRNGPEGKWARWLCTAFNVIEEHGIVEAVADLPVVDGKWHGDCQTLLVSLK
jgi:hypothetical protein